MLEISATESSGTRGEVMTAYYPIVIEEEANGAVSAYAPGLPVYAAADSRAEAEQAISELLGAYLEAHPEPTITATVRVVKATTRQHARPQLAIVGFAAMLGRVRTKAKSAASRRNGRLGGRPRKVAV
jgi:predicted RNase H-like HicB family nuclease